MFSTTILKKEERKNKNKINNMNVFKRDLTYEDENDNEMKMSNFKMSENDLKMSKSMSENDENMSDDMIKVSIMNKESEDRKKSIYNYDFTNFNVQ